MEKENVQDRELSQNEIALENLKEKNAENSALLLNLLFLGGLLAAAFVLFIVFGGEENDKYSGLNGLNAESFFSGEYTAHLSEKFSPKQDFKNKVTFAQKNIMFCFGTGNKITPLTSGNFTSDTENKVRDFAFNNNEENTAVTSDVEEKQISLTQAVTKDSQPKETKKEKKTEEDTNQEEKITQSALPRPAETTIPTDEWGKRITEETTTTTGQKDVTVTMPPSTNNNPPE